MHIPGWVEEAEGWVHSRKARGREYLPARATCLSCFTKIIEDSEKTAGESEKTQKISSTNEHPAEFLKKNAFRESKLY
ncbi:MAG: hypothetical protein V1743_02805 [Nanoarchaeota archaeon]